MAPTHRRLPLYRIVPIAFTRQHLLQEMDAAGVERALLVTPLWEAVRNDYVLESVQARPLRSPHRIPTYVASTMRSARNVCSGAQTFRARPAPTNRASRC